MQAPVWPILMQVTTVCHEYNIVIALVLSLQSYFCYIKMYEGAFTEGEEQRMICLPHTLGNGYVSHLLNQKFPKVPSAIHCEVVKL